MSGVPKEKIAEAARLYASGKPAAIIFGLGMTQHTHGTDNILALADLAMLTGNIGVAGAGVNPLRGHNNVQGACDVGCTPTTYPGYAQVADDSSRKSMEEAWGCALPDGPGLTLTEIFGAAAGGRVKAMYITGENPLLSEPDIAHVQEALEKLEFLVVQDIFLTETAALADVVLPAVTFAERDGTVTNAERRIQRIRQAIPFQGEARPDWWITCQIAKRLGASGFDYEDPSQIMAEIAGVAPIYGGVSYARLENGGLQWPCPTSDHSGTAIMHVDEFTRGKGRFAALQYRPSAEVADTDYPFTLTTTRSLFQFHTGTLTRKVRGLNFLKPGEALEINVKDAERLGIADGDLIRVSSRRGRVEARAKLTEGVAPGVVSMTFHFAEAPTNMVTNPALDPNSKIAELKVCAVRLEKVREGAGVRR